MAELHRGGQVMKPSGRELLAMLSWRLLGARPNRPRGPLFLITFVAILIALMPLPAAADTSSSSTPTSPSGAPGIPAGLVAAMANHEVSSAATDVLHRAAVKTRPTIPNVPGAVPLYDPASANPPKPTPPPAPTGEAIPKHLGETLAATPDAPIGSDVVDGTVSGGGPHYVYGQSLEVTSARTATSQTYANPDGTRTTFYNAAPIFAQRTNGQWTPIDETLIPDGNGRLQAVTGDTAASLATSGNQTLSTLTLDSTHSASFSLAGAAGTDYPALSGSTATYASILPNTDLSLTAQAGGVNEDIILHSATSPTTYDFPLSLTGLSASVDPVTDNVELKDASGAVLITIPHPWMADANIDPQSGLGASSGAITQSLVPWPTQQGMGQAVEVTLDKAWISDPARVFPITVDPTYVTDSDATYVSSAYPNQSYAGSNDLHLGTWNSGADQNLIYLHFSGANNVAGDNITSATLSGWNAVSWSCSARESDVYRVTTSWSGGSTTWNAQPAYDGTSGSGTTSTYGYTGCASNWIAWNVTNIAHAWALGTPNDGLTVRVPSLVDNSYWKRFTGAPGGGFQLSETAVTDGAPNITGMIPSNGASVTALPLTLTLSGIDQDNFPGRGLTFDFNLCNNSAMQSTGSTGGVANWCQNSGWTGSQNWSPANLAWGQTYYWTGQDYDTMLYSPVSAVASFSTTVPQPPGNHLGTDSYSANNGGVDIASGNFFSQATDASVPGVGPALVLVRSYNSQNTIDVGFGTGWSDSLGASAQITPNPSFPTYPTGVLITSGDGHQEEFAQNGTSYFAAPGYFATLVSSGGGWVLTQKDGSSATFNSSGQLIALSNAQGHALSLTYTSGQLTTVTNAVNNRTLSFTWSANHISQVATQAVNGAPITWTYSYSGSNLTRGCVNTTPSATCTNYGYGADGSATELTSITKPAGNTAVSLTYDGTGQGIVSTRKDGASPQNQWSYAYSSTQTGSTRTVTEPAINGSTHNVTYTFDVFGRQTSITDENGNVKTTAYDEVGNVDSYTDENDHVVSVAHDSRGNALARNVYLSTSTGTNSSFAVPVFAQAPSNSMQENWYISSSNNWNGPLGIGSTNASYSAPTAVENNATGNIDVFVEGPSNSLYHYWYLTSTNQWYGPGGVGNVNTTYSAPVAVENQATGNIDVFAQGPSNSLYHWWEVSNTWYGPGGVGNVNTTYSAPAAVENQASGNIDLFAQGPSNSLYHWWEVSGTWYGPGGVGNVNTTYSAPAAVENQSSGTVDLFAQGPSNSLYHWWEVSGTWYGPGGVGNVNTTYSAPAAVEDQPTGNIYVFNEAGSNSLYEYWYANGTWNGPLGVGNVSTTTSAPATVVQDFSSTYTYPADPETTSYTYNEYGGADPRNDTMATMVDPNNNTTSYTYNNTGQLLNKTMPPTTACSSGCQTTWAYTAGTEPAIGGGTEPGGLLASKTVSGGGVTSYAYFSNGDLAQVTDPVGLVTAYTYDTLGRQLTTTQTSDTYPSGVTTTTVYDQLNRVTSVTQPLTTDAVSSVTHQQLTTNTYDTNSNLHIQTVSDATGHDATTRTTTTVYDGDDRVQSVTDPLNRVTSYTYDALSNVATKTMPNGAVYAYTYTNRSQLATTTLDNFVDNPVNPGTPRNVVLASYAYDPARRLASVTDAGGRTTAYTYYADNKTASVTMPSFHNQDGSTRVLTLHAYTYDLAGNLLTDTVGDGSHDQEVTTNTYDAANELLTTSIGPGLGRVTTNTYDQDGNVTQVQRTCSCSQTTETTQTTYDAADRPLKTKVALGASWLTTTLTRDKRGVVTSSTDANGNLTTFASDQLGQTTTVTAPTVNETSNGSTPAPGNPVTLTGYDTFGDKVHQKDPNGNIITTTYDADGEETSSVLPAYTPPGGSQLTPTITFSNRNALGEPQTVTDARGNATTYVYDMRGRVYQQTDPVITGQSSGGVTTTTYNDTDTVASVTDPTGAQTTHASTGYYTSGYDDLDRVIQTNVLERTPSVATYSTKYSYDDLGDVASTTLPDTESATAVYDAAGEATAATDASGQTSTQTYDLDGRPVTTTDPLGRMVTNTYDQAGRLTQVQNFVTTVTSLTVALSAGTPYTSLAVAALPQAVNAGDTVAVGTGSTADQFVVSAVAAQGATSISVTSAAPVNSHSSGSVVTDANPGPAIQTNSYGYDNNGNSTSATPPSGHATTAAYDALNRVSSITTPVSSIVSDTVSFGYDAASNQTLQTDPKGHATVITYNTLNLPESTIQPPVAEMSSTLGSALFTPASTTLTTRLTAGHRYSSLSVASLTTAVTSGDSVKIGSGSSTQTVTASATANVGATSISVTQFTSTYNQSTGAAVNDLTNPQYTSLVVAATAVPVSSGDTIQIGTGGSAQNVTASANVAVGATTVPVNSFTSTYNQSSGTAVADISSAPGTTTVSYDANGNPVTTTRPGAVSITQSFNQMNWLTSESGSGGQSSTTLPRSLGYDLGGRLTSFATPNSGTQTLSYNDRGNVVSSSGPEGSASYTYNGDDLLTQRVDASGTASFSYVAAGTNGALQLASASDPLTGTTRTYSYDGAGQMTGVSYGSGNANEAFSYDSLGRTTSDTAKTSSGVTLYSLGYTYDPNSNLATMALSPSGVASYGTGDHTNHYSYDWANELTTWTNTSGAATTYGYDGSGNRTSAGSTTFTYDARNRMVSSVTGGTTSSYWYTPRGTLLQTQAGSTTTTFAADAFDRITTAGTSLYAYDSLGRIGTANSRTFSYAGSEPGVVNDGTNLYARGITGNLLAEGTTSSNAAVVGNLHGDVLATLKPSASSLTSSSAYDPFGAVTQTVGTAPGSVGYQGAWTDPSAGGSATGGLVSMQSRLYSPTLGQFITQDSGPPPISSGMGMNRYAYVGNDPLTTVDPTGTGPVALDCPPDVEVCTAPDIGLLIYGFLSELLNSPSGGGGAQSASTCGSNSYRAGCTPMGITDLPLPSTKGDYQCGYNICMADGSIIPDTYFKSESDTCSPGDPFCTPTSPTTTPTTPTSGRGKTAGNGAPPYNCAAIGACMLPGQTFVPTGPPPAALATSPGVLPSPYAVQAPFVSRDATNPADPPNSLQSGTCEDGVPSGSGGLMPACIPVQPDEECTGPGVSQNGLWKTPSGWVCENTGSLTNPKATSSGSGAAAEGDFVDLYHGTTSAAAAGIRENGIDLSLANPRTDFGPGFYTTRSFEQAAARAEAVGGPGAGEVLQYRVPTSLFDELSGQTFDSGDGTYASFLRGIRGGGMHAFDYVEGPVLRNPGGFYSGKDPVTFGNQVSFHTPTAVDLLNGYLLP